MNFDVAGPFEVSRHGPKALITKQSEADLKLQLEEWAGGLSEACGCYVFALRAGKGYTPHYVGQACKNSLLKESLNATNVVAYNEILGESKGTPVLFLIPLLTPNGKFRKQTTGERAIPEVDFLEHWLIAEALRKNDGLKNNKETRFLRKIHVVGIFNSRQGEATLASRELKEAIY
jgi:hypothetical protein